MSSTELPEIVEQWNKRSEAARESLTRWSINNVTQLIGTEMDTAVERLRCDRDDIKEETFLSITPRSMTSLLKPEVPTLWKVFRTEHAFRRLPARLFEESECKFIPQDLHGLR